MKTEGVTLDFTEDAIDAIADIAVAVNSSVENIGARRLQTVMERVLDEISFTATDRSGETREDRRRLCAEAYRRSGEERGSEPVYSVSQRSPLPHPHVKRALAAMADGGVIEADDIFAEFRQRQPHRHLRV